MGYAKLNDLSLTFVKERVNVTGFVCDHAKLKDPSLYFMNENVSVMGFA